MEFRNVSDHVTLTGDSFRYVSGLTKEERELVRAGHEGSDSDIFVVARFPFRNGYRWYDIVANKSYKYTDYSNKVAAGYKYFATPIREQDVIDILDEEFPDGRGKRSMLVPFNGDRWRKERRIW